MFYVSSVGGYIVDVSKSNIKDSWKSTLSLIIWDTSKTWNGVCQCTMWFPSLTSWWSHCRCVKVLHERQLKTYIKPYGKYMYIWDTGKTWNGVRQCTMEFPVYMMSFPVYMVRPIYVIYSQADCFGIREKFRDWAVKYNLKKTTVKTKYCLWKW